MSIIKIKIDREGNAEVKPQGFVGDACLAATKPLEDLIGSPENRERTSEAYATPVEQAAEIQQ